MRSNAQSETAKCSQRLARQTNSATLNKSGESRLILLERAAEAGGEKMLKMQNTSSSVFDLLAKLEILDCLTLVSELLKLGHKLSCCSSSWL